VFGYPDVRVAGWGPLFGGVVLLTVVGWCMFLLTFRTRKWESGWMWLISLAIMVSVFLNTESWWARFSPQLWLVPVICCVFFFSLRPVHFHLTGYALALTLTLNLLLVSYGYLSRNIPSTFEVRSQMAALSEREAPILVDFGDFEQSGRRRFQEWGVRYQQRENLSTEQCASLFEIESSTTKVCVQP
jgi:hypothetical protein